MSHPHFAEPRWLWMALLAPLILFALQRYSDWARRKQLSRFAAAEFIERLTPSHSPWRRTLKQILLLLGMAAIGLALARPQWGEQAETTQALGQDVVFLLDCSRSMMAADVSPTRLQRAKLAILDFTRRRGFGRLGLVTFAGQAFLQCPLTFDYDAFQESLLSVDDKTIAVPGTDIGRAVDEAFRAMDKDARQKFMILITDGEDLEKGGIRTAEELAKKGIVVFAIGVGTPAGSEIQVMNDQGRLEYVRDNKGEIVRSRLDEPTLRSISQATGGAYFPLGQLGEGLSRVRLAMEKIDNGSAGVPLRKFGIDRFHLPVAAAALLLVLESLVGTRRRTQAR